MPRLRRQPLLDAFGGEIKPSDEVVCVVAFVAATDNGGEITISAGSIHKGDDDVVRKLSRYFVPVGTSPARREVAFARVTGAP